MHCNDRDNLVEQLSVELGRGKRQPFEKVVEIPSSDVEIVDCNVHLFLENIRIIEVLSIEETSEIPHN